MNKTAIKLIALDIDGTILDKGYNLSDKMRNTIIKAVNADVIVVLATGRMYSAAVPIAELAHVKTPLITYQGSMIREFHNSDKILLHYTLSPDIAKGVIADLRRFKVQTNLYLNDEMFVEKEHPILINYAEKRHIVYHRVNDFNKITDLQPTKILAMDHDADKVTEIRDILREKYDKYLNITKSTAHYCEFVNNKASKANALSFLARMWGIENSEIMAIGDQENDKDMLEVAGLAVAMGNGDEELKKIADYVTDTVDNNGAALAIEKFVLE